MKAENIEIMKWIVRNERNLYPRIFPREVSLKRMRVNTLEELWNYALENQNEDKYCSVFSVRQIFEKTYDTVFLDIDGEDTDSAYHKFREVIKILNDEGLQPRCYFSGKGFHVYLDFEPLKIDGYKERCRALVKNMGLADYVDMSAVGDVRRMARLPYTINTKTGRMMIGVHELMSCSDIIEKSENYKVYPVAIGHNNIGQRLLNIKVEEKKWQTIARLEKLKDVPSCISNIVKELAETGELAHDKRLLLATYLLNLGKIDDCREIFKACKDYDVYKTNYQIDWLLRNEYETLKCERIRNELHVCEGKCMFYPSISRRVKEVGKRAI